MRSPRIPVMRAIVLPPYVKFQSCRLSLSEVMADFKFMALSGPLTFIFDLLSSKLECNVTSDRVNVPTNFVVRLVFVEQWANTRDRDGVTS